MLEQGYGLVRFYTLQDAQAAIEKFHGTELEGRTLTVRLDKCAPAPRACLEQRPQSAGCCTELACVCKWWKRACVGALRAFCAEQCIV